MSLSLAALLLVGTGCPSGDEPDAIMRVTCGVSAYDPSVGHQVTHPTATLTIEVRGATPTDYQQLLGTAGYGERRVCTFELEYIRDDLAEAAR